MSITQHFDLNLIPESAPVVVHCDQYDTGTGRLVVSLYEGDTPYTPTGSAIIQGTKPDGHGFIYNASMSDNVVTANLTNQMSAVAGPVRCQIVVTESTGRTGTFAFILDVQASALPNDADMSDSDYQLVETLLEEVETAASEIETSKQAAEDAAEDSEAWAVGTRGGDPVGPSDPTYHNNSKYWAEHGGGGGGGHTIVNADGQDMPQRGSLQFMADVEDDAQRDMTIVKGAGGSTINVTTTETTLYGKNVTISDGNKTWTKAFSNTGAVSFTGIPSTGNLTITSTDGSETATSTLNIPYFGNYSVALTFFTATVTVTGGTGSLGGCTVKAIKGGVVVATGTLSNIPGQYSQYTFTLGESGTYTFEVVNDWKTFTSDPVNVTQETSYSVTVNGFETDIILSTTSAAFKGQDVVVTSSGVPTKTITIDSTTGSVVYRALQAGTYTFTLTYMGEPYVTTANVTVTDTTVSVVLNMWTATINISTSSSDLYGKVVKIYKDGTLLPTSVTFSGSGTASYTTHEAGTFKFGCVYDNYEFQSADVVVSSETTYNATITAFSATLSISTTSSELYSQTITIKKGSTTVGTTAFSSGGSASYVVHETGEYTAECEGYSGSATVSAETTYSITINAGLDLSSWITAGSTTDYPLNPSSYADFSALEADEAAIRQLMLVHDAVDYLATASAGDSLMESVIGSDVCAKWINLSDYALDTLYANSDIADEMDTADKYGYGEWGIVDSTTTPPTWGALGCVPIMTANNAPYGVASADSEYGTSNAAWKAFDGDGETWWASSNSGTHSIQYDFPAPVCVKKISYKQTGAAQVSSLHDCTYKIQYKNGSTWDDVDTYNMYANANVGEQDIDNDNYSMSWKLVFVTNNRESGYANMASLQFYGRELKPLVPTMTANDKPKGEVVASSASSTGSGFPAWKAFDGDTTTSSDIWAEADAQAPNASWCGYKPVGTDFKCVMFGINAAYITRASSIILQGSDDGFVTTPDNIKTVAKDTDYSTNSTLYVFPLDTPVKKGAFRLYFNKVSGLASGQTTNVKLIQFYGMDYSEKEFASGSTAKWIYDHGVKPSGAITGGTDDGNNLTLSAVGTAVVTIDKGTRTYMGGKAGLHASGTNRLKCGSGYSAFTASNMPDSNGFDISSISGSVAVGIEQTASGTFDCTEIWIE